MLNLKVKSWVLLAPLLLALSTALLTLVLSKALPPKLPLFYSLSWGEQQLVSHQQLLIIPSSIALVTLLNLVISWQLHPQQVFFKKILLISTYLVSLILGITFFKII